jgi:hypothetical protein
MTDLPPKSELKLLLDAGAGCAVLEHLLWADWWDWSAGSSLAFWRWNGDEQIRDARDGMKMWVKGTLPNDRTPQPTPKKSESALMLEKLEKVLGQGYISPGLILSLTAYSGVPKGLDNIWLVYGGTRSGLNAALWAPSFWMPNAS